MSSKVKAKGEITNMNYSGNRKHLDAGRVVLRKIELVRELMHPSEFLFAKA